MFAHPVAGFWMEPFKEVLNQPSPTELFNFENEIILEQLGVIEDAITEDEVKRAIKKLENNKASGADQITAELLKHGGNVVIKGLTKLLNNCWKERQVPEEGTRRKALCLMKMIRTLLHTYRYSQCIS